MCAQFRVDRRNFLRVSAAAGAAAMLGRAGFGASASPGAKLNVAVIGVGGRGGANLAESAAENIVALCDIDDNHLAAAARSFPKARTFVDFRRMLETMDRQIDAVVVSTPDHTHAPASAMAMRMGKHCFCEKPLTHTVHEARTLAQLAREKKLATQMGTVIHACDNYRRVVELVQSGAIGPVVEVHVWCDKNWGGGRRPAKTVPVPKNIHWDEWIGPARFRPYDPCYYSGNWRRHWEFGTGTLGDMACHLVDLPFWALKLRHPTTVAADGPPVDAEGCPTDLAVHYDFPARGTMPAVKLSWYDGGRRPRLAGEVKVPLGGMGILFIGKEGLLRADYGSWKLYPEAKFADFKPPVPTIPASVGHHREFFEACKQGTPTTCNFDYSGALSEAVLLGTVAYRVGKKLHWDAEKLTAVNCPEAQQYLSVPYREGWKL
jgi:predicted dehydrogenase